MSLYAKVKDRVPDFNNPRAVGQVLIVSLLYVVGLNDFHGIFVRSLEHEISGACCEFNCRPS